MLTFQEIIDNLYSYWKKKGCIQIQSYDLEMGAATFHPATVLRVIDKEPWSAIFLQPCRRPSDGCLLYTSPSPRDATLSRMPSSA